MKNNKLDLMYIYKHFSNTEQLSGQSLKKGISLSNQQKNSVTVKSEIIGEEVAPIMKPNSLAIKKNIQSSHIKLSKLKGQAS